jgi:hypothetical protein
LIKKKQRITDQTIQNQYSSLKENNKLNFYRKIYRMNERPPGPYVDVCRFRTDRSTRISAHRLAGQVVEYVRLVTLGNLEDEFHFFIHCP